MTDDQEIRTVTPFPLAMVVCDSIYRDPFNGKFTLIGTFSTIFAKEFPVRHPHLFVYAALTGGRGKVPLRVEVVDIDGYELLAEMRGEIDSKNDPRAIQELAFGFAGLVFPKQGEYRIALYANNEFMVERRLLVFNPENHHDN